MRFMMLVKASPQTEAGELPPPEAFATMMKYNEELANAGMMLAGEGLHPSAKGARIRFGHGQPAVLPGPFKNSNANELICGFWIIQAKDMAEAIDWAKRAPFPEGELEIRQIQELEDFGAEFPRELKMREERLREKIEQQAS